MKTEIRSGRCQLISPARKRYSLNERLSGNEGGLPMEVGGDRSGMREQGFQVVGTIEMHRQFGIDLMQ